MDRRNLKNLGPIKGNLSFNEPLEKYTSMRVGGPAEIFFQPYDLKELKLFLSKLDKSVPIFWLGRGSNLLIRDQGISGAVISLLLIKKEIIKVNEHCIEVSANVPCTMLSRQCMRWGMAPSEFFSGIPGSLGGALTMNAGAYGHETWDTVESVKVITRKGELIERHPSAYKVRYRKVEGPKNEWFVSAKLVFDQKKSASISKQREMLSKRKSSQPLGKPSCGSVFKNPKGDHAARLIQEAGLKGYRIGGGKISEKHANFIINEGDALASDIESLIIHVQKEIIQKFNIKLQCEVKIVGNK